MSKYLRFEVEENLEQLKMREYLKDKCGLSGRFIKSAAKEGRIFINNKKIKSSYIIKEGDLIEIKVNKEESQDIAPQKMDLKIVYEDDYLLIVDKPPFMVVHPTKSHPDGTLSNGIMNYFKESNQDCIVRLANRLDMNTSGLVMIAKNQFAHMKVSEYMQNDLIKKEYKAIVHGTLENKSGTIDEPIGRRTLDSIKREVMDEGQPCITHYNVEEEFEEGSLLGLILETGRTHQIRVHLSHINHPIFADSLYGKVEDEYIERQALHAYKLTFPHLISGEIIEAKSEMPADMKNLCNKARSKNK